VKLPAPGASTTKKTLIFVTFGFGYQTPTWSPSPLGAHLSTRAKLIVHFEIAGGSNVNSEFGSRN